LIKKIKNLTDKFSLSEKDFYVWLFRQYPQTEDSKPEGIIHAVSARESIADFSDSVLRQLKDRGTLAACEAIQKIAQALPQLNWLKWTLLKAQHITRQRTWVPPKPSDILAIAKNQQGSSPEWRAVA